MIRLNKLNDKFIILLTCIILSSHCRQDFTLTVTASLLAVTISALSQCIKNYRIAYAMQFFYIFLCIMIPEFCFVFPVVAYEIIQNKNNYINLIFIFPPIYYCLTISFRLGLLIILFTIISVILSYRNLNLNALHEKLIIQRDSLEENKILLTSHNEHLINTLDNEIDLAILTERTRIAREIHDNVGHMLSRTLLQLGALKVINSDEKIKPQLNNLSESLNTAMTSIRESVHNLHDNAVSLENTIKELIKPLSENYSVRLDIDVSENTPREIKFCFIGVVKEAISNILRHSSADSVNIIIREHPAFYQTVIEDNGGINGKINEGGIGMESMRSRTKKLNGIFKCYAEKDSFKIFLSIPKKEI